MIRRDSVKISRCRHTGTNKVCRLKCTKVCNSFSLQKKLADSYMYLRRLLYQKSQNCFSSWRILNSTSNYLSMGRGKGEVLRFGLVENVMVTDQNPIPLSLGITFPQIGTLISREFFEKKIPISRHFFQNF